MAENDAEKTEKATPKKKRQAKKKGDVAKSEEISNAIFFIFAIFMLKVGGKYIFNGFENLLVWGIRNNNMPINLLNTQNLFLFYTIRYFFIFLPIALLLLIVSVSASLLQVGWIFTTDKLKWKWDSINPVNGFKQLFSLSSLKKLVKGVLKIFVISVISYFTLKNELDVIMSFIDLEVPEIMFHFIRIIVKLLYSFLWFYLVFATVDFIITKYLHMKKMKMSKQEVKDERKQMEGDPHVKQQIRKQMMQQSLKRMMADIPEADVVITNPIHLALALRYKSEKDDAPVVVAKGKRKIAEKIKKIARENKIPIIENKPLARILYKVTKVGKEIPVDMYNAVAEILAEVYKLKKNNR